MFSVLNMLGGLLGNILGKSTADKDKILEAQNRINEKEVEGAPQSILRLWRSFLMWVLSLVFVWEVVARTLIITYWPDIVLPPSMLKEVMTLLVGGLGLGI